jgi:hypothetical protein
MTSSINTNNHSPGLQFRVGTCRSIGYKSVDSCLIQNSMLGGVQNFEQKILPIKMENQRANVMRKHQEIGHKKIVIFQLHGGALSNCATRYPIVPRERERRGRMHKIH